MTRALSITRRNGYLKSATDGILSWARLDKDTLTHIETGKVIYQMHWLNENYQMAEPVTGEMKDAVLSFWAMLETVEDCVVEIGEETLPVNVGVCPKCHTYCNGDCEASR